MPRSNSKTLACTLMYGVIWKDAAAKLGITIEKTIWNPHWHQGATATVRQDHLRDKIKRSDTSKMTGMLAVHRQAVQAGLQMVSVCRPTRWATTIEWPQTIRTSRTWEAVLRILLFLLLSAAAVPLLFLLLVMSGLLPTQKSQWVKLLMLRDHRTSDDLGWPRWTEGRGSEIHLFGCRGHSFRFHRLGLLLAGGFGSLALLLLHGERRVARGTRALAVFEGVWRDRRSRVSSVPGGGSSGGRRGERTYWFRSRPSSAWLPRSSHGRWRCGPEREVEREQMFESGWQEAAVEGGRQWRASVRRLLTLLRSLRSFSSFFSLDRPGGVSMSFFSISLSRLMDRETEL